MVDWLTDSDLCAHDVAGRLGKRVAMRLSSQGARVMVTVEAFCPRRSLFLLRNEQDGTVRVG